MKQSRDIFRFSFFSLNSQRLEIIVLLTIFFHTYAVYSVYVYISHSARQKYLADCVLCSITIFYRSLLLTNLQYLGWRLRRRCWWTWGVTTPPSYPCCCSTHPTWTPWIGMTVLAIACKEDCTNIVFPAPCCRDQRQYTGTFLFSVFYAYKFKRKNVDRKQ